MTAKSSQGSRSFLRALLGACCGVLLLGTASASAVTPKELIELTRAGLSDDVLVALIEADQGGVRLDAEQIITLRNAGVSERVILALLQEQRRQADAAAALEPAPVVEPPPPAVDTAVPMTPPEPAPVVVQQQVPVLVPFWVPVAPVRGVTVVPIKPRSGFGRFINDGWVNGTLPTAQVPIPKTRHR